MFINIEVERLRHAMSKNTLAAALDVSTDMLYNWICRREAIPAKKLRALSQLFGCSADYLLKEGGEKWKPYNCSKQGR